ncbi:hypothetical protein [Nocardia xishanensis]|uniref:hypothetical protein n=1 Tax=Nocardia xishanensis TaxID=238964 RepID=UPI00344819E0
MYLIRIGASQNGHQGGTATGMGGEDQPVAPHCRPRRRGEPGKRVIDQLLERAGLQQGRECVSRRIHTAALGLMMTARQDEHGRCRPAYRSWITRVREIQTADRLLVLNDIHRRTVSRISVQMNDDIHHRRLDHAVPLDEHIRRCAGVRSQQRVAGHDQPAGCNGPPWCFVPVDQMVVFA